MRKILALTALSGIAMLTPAFAGFDTTYTLTSGTTTDGHTVSGIAEFVYVTGANTLTVYLRNDSQDVNHTLSAVTQVLTGVQFTTAPTSTTIGGPTGATINTSATGGNHTGWDCTSGTCVIAQPTGAQAIASGNWTESGTGSTHDLLTNLNNQPDFGIVNDHIKGGNGGLDNPTHNPYIMDTTFVLSVNPVDLTGITAASLQFGSQPGINLFTATTPEPTFYGLLAVGMGALLVIRRRKLA
jgi:hypothetical protein